MPKPSQRIVIGLCLTHHKSLTMRRLILASFLACAAAVASAQVPNLELPPQQISSSFGDSAWKPTDALVQGLVKQTNDYFKARDEKRFADAYAYFSPSQKQQVPFEGWKKQLEDFYAGAGAVEERSIKKITWYKNPPNTQPGIYAATDYSGKFQNLTLHCGYIAWRQLLNGTFELVREESNSIEKSVAAKMSAEDFKRVRVEFRC